MLSLFFVSDLYTHSSVSTAPAAPKGAGAPAAPVVAAAPKAPAAPAAPKGAGAPAAPVVAAAPKAPAAPVAELPRTLTMKTRGVSANPMGKSTGPRPSCLAQAINLAASGHHKQWHGGALAQGTQQQPASLSSESPRLPPRARACCQSPQVPPRTCPAGSCPEAAWQCRAP
jgi:hypothetical protein